MGQAPEVSAGGHSGATLIERINNLRASSLPFAAPKKALQTSEASLVCDVLQVLQGFPTRTLPWDDTGQQFYVRNGIHILHLSQSSLYTILQSFSCAATSLRRVEFFVQRVVNGTTKSWLKPIAQAYPTLEAFVNVVHMRLESLRKVALDKELEAAAGKAGTSVTLLSLFAQLSRVFAGAGFLEHVVDIAIPDPERLFKNKMNAAELATHILSSLYEELDAFCLLQDGEEDAYATLLLLFLGCLRPMIASLDTWLQEGILSDPAGELFFYANKSVLIEDSAFWGSAYHLRQIDVSSEEDSQPSSRHQGPGSHKDPTNFSLAGGIVRSSRKLSKGSSSSLNGDVSDGLVCPKFLQPLAKAILSAGKSLQLLQYVRRKHVEGDRDNSSVANAASKMPSPFLPVGFTFMMRGSGKKGSSEFDTISSSDNSISDVSHLTNHRTSDQVTLYETFCAALRTLLGESPAEGYYNEGSVSLGAIDSSFLCLSSSQGIPAKDGLLDILFQRQRLEPVGSLLCVKNEVSYHEGNHDPGKNIDPKKLSLDDECVGLETPSDGTGKQLTAQNGSEHIIKGFGTAFVFDSKSTVRDTKIWKDWLNLSQNCQLAGLDDADLRRAVFDPLRVDEAQIPNQEVEMALDSVVEEKQHEENIHGIGENIVAEPHFSSVTDFNYGPGCGNLLLLHDRQNLKAIEKLLPNPTLLPYFKEQSYVSKQLPSRSDNLKTVSMLEWLQSATLKATPALVLVQECLISSIQMQVDHVGQQLLAKLMGEWRLMEEIALLRAIYLVGSGMTFLGFMQVVNSSLVFTRLMLRCTLYVVCNVVPLKELDFSCLGLYSNFNMMSMLFISILPYVIQYLVNRVVEN